MNKKFLVAQLGRTIGLRGDLKLHLHTDFPEQFKKGNRFLSDRGELEILAYNPKRNTIRFVGFEDVDSAKRLTNTKLYATLKQTKLQCKLNKDEYFWFEIIGCNITDESGEVLGEVKEVQRLVDADYLHVKTDPLLVEKGLPKSFLIPYIERYIKDVDIDAQRIDTVDSKAILETS